jgi:hypothetical protein
VLGLRQLGDEVCRVPERDELTTARSRIRAEIASPRDRSGESRWSGLPPASRNALLISSIKMRRGLDLDIRGELTGPDQKLPKLHGEGIVSAISVPSPAAANHSRAINSIVGQF